MSLSDLVSTLITAAGPKVLLTAGDASTGTPAVRCSDAPTGDQLTGLHIKLKRDTATSVYFGVWRAPSVT